MLNALHYYWVIAKGYRMRPWASPYLQWRLETYFGKEAADLDRRVGRNHTVHRARHDRRLESVRVDLPCHRDFFGVASASRRHDGDVVETVSTTGHLAHTDLDLGHSEALL